MARSYSDLRAASQRIMATADDELRAEIEKLRRRKPAWLAPAAAAMARLTTAGSPALVSEAVPDFEMETIVQLVGRPVLAIVGGAVKLEFADAPGAVWKARLEGSAGQLRSPIAAVGRVEVTNHPTGMDYLGTGWLVDSDVIVTNRHVALEFAEQGSQGYTFKIGFDRQNPIGVDLDFLEEIGGRLSAEFRIHEVVFVANEFGPDVAFIRLARSPGLRPIHLATTLPPDGTLVAALGYPAKDPRVPDQALMDRIFSGVYDKKRLAPGLVTGRQPGTVAHDCTTLGGSSGSAIIDLATGDALGLHFAGTFLKANYAVPAPVVASLLKEASRGSTVAVSRRIATPPDEALIAPVQGRADGEAGTSSMSKLDGGGVVTLQVPLEIVVRLAVEPGGTAAGVPPGVMGGGAPTVAGGTLGTAAVPVSREQLARAVELARRELSARTDVIAVKPGYWFKDGWITNQQVVVVGIAKKLSPEQLAAQGKTLIPSAFLGVPVDVTPASATDFVRRETGVDLEARAWVSNYRPRPHLPLEEVNERMRVTLHAGPDAGWPLLKAFLGRTRKRLTVGMYDFTARHIIDAVKAAIGDRTSELKLVIQAGESLNSGTKKEDIPDAETVAELKEAIAARFHFAWASTQGPKRLFDSAYHIKVAVRDGEEVWLSSGNWQSSNQPPHDPRAEGDTNPPLLNRFNREWHVILGHTGLANRLEEHLALDLEEATALEEAAQVPEVALWVPLEFYQPTAAELEARLQYFPPLTVDRAVRVQPLLTPDNYSEHIQALIDSAQERVYFQNQSFSVLAENTPKYQTLLEALLAKQRNGLDVRIIFRRFGDLREAITGLKDFGFDTDKVRLQTNCHTKGIIVDGKAVAVGSHNWTNAGTSFNRDASLIFFDEEIAKYYETLFLFDWNRIGPPRLDESVPAVEIVRELEGQPHPGMVPVSASRWLSW